MAPQQRQMRIQSVRFAEPTWAAIQRTSRDSGVSASQYIREAVIARLAWDIALSEPELMEDWQRIHELIRQLTVGHE